MAVKCNFDEKIYCTLNMIHETGEYLETSDTLKTYDPLI